MKLPNAEHFNYKECEFSGEKCWLITPKRSDEDIWSEDNLGFRSIIIRQDDNYVVSRSLPKFFNHLENPKLSKFDEEKDFFALPKIDGSLLIVSKYKGELILRTRGTTDISTLPNGYEKEFLLEKYKEFFDFIVNNKTYETWPWSYLFEWQTKTNIIVLDEVDEPTLTPLCMVYNKTGALSPIHILWKDMKCFDGNLLQPIYFNSLNDCIRSLDNVEKFEGYVLYQLDEQRGEYKMIKAKTEWYRERHYLLTCIGKSPKRFIGYFMKYLEEDYSLENVIKVHGEFFDKFKAEYSYEVFIHCEELLKMTRFSVKKSIEIVENIQFIINNIKQTTSDKKEISYMIRSKFEHWPLFTSIAYELSNKGTVGKLLWSKLFEKKL